MRNVLAQGRFSNVMFNNVAGQNHAMTSLGGKLADYKILRQIVFQPRESADGLQNSSAGNNCGPDSKPHSFQHSRDQGPTPKIGIHAGGFEARPEARSGNGAVRTRRNSHMIVSKFSGDGTQ